jgi:hypothetical protein
LGITIVFCPEISLANTSVAAGLPAARSSEFCASPTRTFPFTHNAVSDLRLLPVSVHCCSGFLRLYFIQSLWCSVLFSIQIVADITTLVTEHEVCAEDAESAEVFTLVTEHKVRVRWIQKVPRFCTQASFLYYRVPRIGRSILIAVRLGF